MGFFLSVIVLGLQTYHVNDDIEHDLSFAWNRSMTQWVSLTVMCPFTTNQNRLLVQPYILWQKSKDGYLTPNYYIVNIFKI